MDAAIARVLAHEREAERQVGFCRAEGARQVQQAQTRARVILERADRRIARVHGLADDMIERQLAPIEAVVASLQEIPEPTAEERRALSQAIDKLLDELVGTPS